MYLVGNVFVALGEPGGSPDLRGGVGLRVLPQPCLEPLRLSVARVGSTSRNIFVVPMHVCLMTAKHDVERAAARDGGCRMFRYHHAPPGMRGTVTGLW